MFRQIKFIFFVTALLLATGSAVAGQNDHNKLDNRDKILIINSLEREGDRFYKAGLFDEALAKFKAANDPALRLYPGTLGAGLGGMNRVYLMQGEYEKAYEITLRSVAKHPENKWFVEEKMMFGSLVEMKKTGSNQPVYDFISWLIKENESILPPKGYTPNSRALVATILRLYDTIGDHDAGIKYIDESLQAIYTHQKGFKDIKRFTASQDIGDLGTFKGPGKTDRNWRGYKIIREFLLVREAFEQDKNEGTRGRASRALIRSDYFPA